MIWIQICMICGFENVFSKTVVFRDFHFQIQFVQCEAKAVKQQAICRRFFEGWFHCKPLKRLFGLYTVYYTHNFTLLRGMKHGG